MKTVYLDMDGVVADFDRMAIDTLGLDYTPPSGHKFSDPEWEKMRQDPHLYLNLKVISGAKPFVHGVTALCGEMGYRVLFLTAVPSGNDMPWAFYDKIRWADKHFPGIPVWFGPYSRDKHVRAGSDQILIDDRLSNIVDWRRAGGPAVHFQGNFATALGELKSYMRA